MRLLLICSWLLLFLSQASQAEDQLASFSQPEDIAHTDIYLITAGLGAGIESRYGHTIIRIVDGKAARDYNLNWGMFSFDSPNFLVNFSRGYLRYWVDSEPYRNVLYRYQYWDQRPLLINKFNLTSAQKQRFIQGIYDFLNTQGRYYWYQYFFNNCATIPRDLLNAALYGRVEKDFAPQASGKNFRYYVDTYLNSSPPITFLLDILMNQRIDGEINRWQEMFCPLKLQEYLREFPALDDAGVAIPGEFLLGETRELNRHPHIPSASWRLQPYFLFIGLAYLCCCLLLSVATRRFFGESWSRRLRSWGLRAFALALLVWGLFSGIVGSVMLLFWAFSQHLDTHHNANLSILWPLDFFYVLLAIALLRPQGRLLTRCRKAGRSLAQLHLLVGFVAALAWSLGLIQQNMGRMLLYVCPVGLMLNFLFLFRFESLHCRQKLKKSPAEPL